MGKPLSTAMMASEFKRRIRLLVKRMFNKEFFGTYEGIVEVIDDANALIGVTVPDLGGIRIDECRVMTPCLTSGAYIIPVYSVGDRVIITFNSFSLKSPIVLGQIKEPGSEFNLSSANMTLKNGSSFINLLPDGTIYINGTDIRLTASNIQLTGTTITANGEDLTDDDIGVL